MLRDLYWIDAPVTELLKVPIVSMNRMSLTKLPFSSLKLGPYLWTVALSMMSKLFAPLPQTIPVPSVYECVKSKYPEGAANAPGANDKTAASAAAPAMPNQRRLGVDISLCKFICDLLMGRPVPARTRYWGRRRPRSETRSAWGRPAQTFRRNGRTLRGRGSARTQTAGGPGERRRGTPGGRPPRPPRAGPPRPAGPGRGG